MQENYEQPNSNILLNSIIASIQAIRDDQRDLAIKVASLPTREDLRDNQEFVLEQIEEVKSHLKEQDKQFAGVKIEVEKNTELRITIKKASHYVIGAIFMAIITTIGSIYIEPYLMHQFSNNNSSTNTVPKIHIHMPE